MSDKTSSLPYVVDGPPMETKSQLEKAAEANVRHEVLKGTSSEDTDVMNVQERKCKVEIYYIVIAVILGAGLFGVLIYFTVINTINVEAEPVKGEPKTAENDRLQGADSPATTTPAPQVQDERPMQQLRNIGPMAMHVPAAMMAAQPMMGPGPNSENGPQMPQQDDANPEPSSDNAQDPVEQKDPQTAPAQTPTPAPAQTPTAAPAQTPTPAPAQTPTAAPTQAATQAPTQAATQAPAQRQPRMLLRTMTRSRSQEGNVQK